MVEQRSMWKRVAGSFGVLAACAFVLFVLAAVINFLAQLVGLSSPERLSAVVVSLGTSSTLQVIVAIWLLTAAGAIAAPQLWRPLSMTTELLFDIGYGVLGALAGFGLAIGVFGGGWYVLIWAVIYSLLAAAAYLAITHISVLRDVNAWGQRRWIVVGILTVLAPVVLLWL